MIVSVEVLVGLGPVFINNVSYFLIVERSLIQIICSHREDHEIIENGLSLALHLCMDESDLRIYLNSQILNLKAQEREATLETNWHFPSHLLLKASLNSFPSEGETIFLVQMQRKVVTVL